MKNQKKNPLRIVWLLIGFLAMGLGAVGVVLPVLPTTPFLLLASFCLAKGSARFHRWFTGTKLYKKHLESFVENRTMTLKTKFSLLIPASCMLLLAFLAMQNVYGRVFIIFLILFKYVYFFTRIRTVPAGQNRIPETEG
ncbi:YbaN family protein [Mediterraneibacter glycyrrhizinilyticus]|uniref:YbaN family protein n=1 Tax=Mediterraneibacter glycyrrhizinilyticus TaxID=342942 RepID=UPI0025A3FC4C|nr:YbaN family protein [Mediterraneibacter glycyrrhizinilyticus]MDM8209698.1 YbaN family protein [Mediterraneibacter glycyrrhizinilyticus]